jgi:hypothetical protein
MIFGMTTKILLGVIVALVIAMGSSLVYIKYLKSENETLFENNFKLEQAFSQQQDVIAQKKQDIAAIRSSLSVVKNQNDKLSSELNSTERKFNKISSDGKVRDMGELAIGKPELIEKIINRGTVNAKRCYEIATGSPLTEEELNATKRSQINPECPHIANPNYESD